MLFVLVSLKTVIGLLRMVGRHVGLGVHMFETIRWELVFEIVCSDTFVWVLAFDKLHLFGKVQFGLMGDSKPRINALKKNVSDAFMDMGSKYESGEDVFQSDTKSLEMYICAAELGGRESLMHLLGLDIHITKEW